ncbi:MAG: amino acid adenylation domain-containing protein, partial [Clostridia bacterium]|nr:amino acid adenylation domain-containing protein [Clostridia bacterium]
EYDETAAFAADSIADLSVNVKSFGDTFGINMQYCTDLFKKETAEHIINHYIQVLNVIAENQEIKLKDISLADDYERNLILDVFNATYSDYPRDKTVIDLIEAQAAEIPYNTALVFERQTLNYSQMNSMINSLAYTLIENGVKPGDHVALSLEKNIMLPIAILAVLKAGAAYSPIDYTLPSERISVMLNDIDPVCILTNDGTGYEEFNFKNISIDDRSIYTRFCENPRIDIDPESLAYIMYTSGTTGTPKGIMISHKALMSDVNHVVRTYSTDRSTVCLQHGAYTFDLYVEEIYPTLCSGGKVVIMSKELLLNIPEAHRYIHENQVNIVHMTPLLLNEFNKYGWSDYVKTFILGGEKVLPKHVQPLMNMNCSVYQDYGPTENTVVATVYKIKGEYEYPTLNSDWTIPIGKPKRNTKVYIADGNTLCGIGVPGEICIAGDCLALGYLNLPELTAEKFVDNPFGTGKMYHSGDLARWLPDGNIEFLGRIDEQVKIRGIRIELGEVET